MAPALFAKYGQKQAECCSHNLPAALSSLITDFDLRIAYVFFWVVLFVHRPNLRDIARSSCLKLNARNLGKPALRKTRSNWSLIGRELETA